MYLSQLYTVVLALALAAPPASAEEQSAQAANQHFAECPGSTDLQNRADVSWEPRPSNLQSHKALRERLGVPIPSGPTRILLWSVAAELGSVTFSVIAVRSAEGQWHTNGVGEKRLGLGGAPAERISFDRDLSIQQAAALDTALADPCLYEAPTFQRNPSIVAGGAEQTLEIETPRRHHITAWFGARTPQQEAIIDLITE